MPHMFCNFLSICFFFSLQLLIYLNIFFSFFADGELCMSVETITILMYFVADFLDYVILKSINIYIFKNGISLSQTFLSKIYK